MLQSLQYYFTIAYEDKLIDLTKSFYNSGLEEKGFFYNKDRDEYVSFDMLVDSDDPIFDITVINKEKFISLELNKNKKIFIEDLKSKQETSEEKDFTSFLSGVYNDLNGIYIKLGEFRGQVYYDMVIVHLESVIKDLRSLFWLVLQHHKIFNVILSSTDGISFFETKDLKRSFFIKLYELSYKLNLIDDTEVDEVTFIDVLTTPKIDLEKQIKFSAPNYLISHFIDEIGVFFNNLNPKRIGESGMFLNKYNKPILASDMYSAKSRTPQNANEKLSNISSQIKKLKKEYF